MQTIDLGTISIGSEDFSAEQKPIAAPIVKPIPMQSRPAPAPMQRPAPSYPEYPQHEPCDCDDDRRPPPHPHPHPQPCCNKDDIWFEKCEDHKLCNIGETAIGGQGRILELTMKLKNVCPGKRVAVGVALVECDHEGHEYPRGMQTFTIAAHRHQGCSDLPVPPMRFILPEDISVGGCDSPCGSRRHFKAKVVAHYIDFLGTGLCNL